MAKKETSESALSGSAQVSVSSILKSDILSKLRKNYGDNVLSVATQKLAYKRFSSGILILDYGLGGGWPAGRIAHLYGPKSSGKTTTALRAAAELHKVCSNCYTGSFAELQCDCGNFKPTIVAYIDTEDTWDAVWAEKLGVDLERTITARTDFGEQAFDILEGLIRDGQVDLVIFDSIASAVPSKEIEGLMEDQQPGLHARLVSKGMRKVVTALAHQARDNNKLTTVFFLNQIRKKIGVMYGSPDVVTGGEALPYFASVEVRFRAGKEEGKDGQLPSSQEMYFKVEKNKTFPAKLDATYKVALVGHETYKLGTVMDDEDLAYWAEKSGLLTGAAASYMYNGEKYIGKKGFEERIMKDKAFNKQVRTEVLKKLVENAG